MVSCILLGISTPIFAQSSASNHQSDVEVNEGPAALVEQLAHGNFSVRQRATRQLVYQGFAILPHLEKELKGNGSRELQVRVLHICEQLYIKSSDDEGLRVLRTLEQMQPHLNRSMKNRMEGLLAKLRLEEEKRISLRLRTAGASVRLSNQAYTIKLQEAWKGNAEEVALLNRLPNVTWLSFERSTLSDRALGVVGQMTELKKLYLGKSYVQGSGVAHLTALTKLEYLSLLDLPIESESLIHLSQLRQLRSLGLDGTRVDDKGLKHISQLTELKHLWLDRTRVTVNGLFHLEKLKKLVTLQMIRCDLEGSGLASLANLPKLRTLILRGAKLNKETIQELAQLKSVAILGLEDTAITDDDLKQIAQMENIESLWLSRCKISKDGLDHLLKLKRLKKVFLHGTKVTKEEVKEFQKKHGKAVAYL